VVPDSIYVDDIDAPTELEFQVYHFSAVQGGTVVVVVDSNSGLSAGGGGSCFITTVENDVGIILWMIVLYGFVGLIALFVLYRWC
jgi:hypothetical protein